MTETSGAAAWRDARLALRLLAADPVGLGGVWLRSPAGPARDRWMGELRAALPAGAPLVPVPAHVSDDRLLGGLDLAGTLRAGRPVAEAGLLAAAHGGVLVLRGAERVAGGIIAAVAAAMDTGEVVAERDGLGSRRPSRFALVALDEGEDAEERCPSALADRLAFRLDLTASSLRDLEAEPEQAEAGRAEPAEAALEALTAAGLALGVDSLRAPLLALRAARAAAALRGRPEPAMADLETAARLVLAPRATRLPASASADEEPPDSPDSVPDGRDDGDPGGGEAAGPLPDRVLAAAIASIPPGLLSGLRLRQRPGAGARRSGAGALRRDRVRGRPAGSMRGDPRRGARLDLVETLRAAAPWQAIRRPPGDRRIVVRKDDLRVRRFKRQVETTTVFVVDASGSSAFHRLAEAKGAVELLLAESYVRRDRVALIAFRGQTAELLLPPTRSLARAKRALAALPGGGGTPLAAAIDTAGALAASVARTGASPVLVFLTDGRANIARDGRPGRETAAADAERAARALAATSAKALFIDTSPRPAEATASLARLMGARYLPLPAADAHALSSTIRAEVDAAGRGGR